jgi:hypothetical protein
MNEGNASVSLFCWSLIDPESSTTKRMSTFLQPSPSSPLSLSVVVVSSKPTSSLMPPPPVVVVLPPLSVAVPLSSVVEVPVADALPLALSDAEAEADADADADSDADAVEIPEDADALAEAVAAVSSPQASAREAQKRRGDQRA